MTSAEIAASHRAALVEENERLRDENADLNESNLAYQKEFARQREEIERLTAERDEARIKFADLRKLSKGRERHVEQLIRERDAARAELKQAMEEQVRILRGE